MGVLMRIAWRNLWRGWRRSAVVVTAITIGLWGMLVLVAWSVGMMKQMTDVAVRTQLGHLAVHAEGYNASPDPERSIPDSGRRIVEELSTRGGVHAAPRLQGGGLIQSARRSSRAALVGVVPALERDVSSVADSLIAGSYLDPPSGRTNRPILIGAELAERLRVGLGDKVVMRVPGDYGLGAFRVAGIYRTVSDAFDEVFVFVALEDAQRLLDVGDRVTAVVAALDDPDDGPVVQSWAQTRLGEILPEQRLEVLTWQEREPRGQVHVDAAKAAADVDHPLACQVQPFDDSVHRRRPAGREKALAPDQLQHVEHLGFVFVVVGVLVHRIASISPCFFGGTSSVNQQG